MTIPARVNLLGIDVDIVTPDEVMEIIQERIGHPSPTVIVNHNLHSVYLAHKYPQMRALYAQADLIEIDSTPLIMWGRLLGHKLSTRHRSTYLDFRDTFWKLAEDNQWRVFHVGSRPEHIYASRDRIVARYPNLQLYVHSGYFDINGPENDALLEALAATSPDVVLIGMGMPRQEVWIERNFSRLPSAVILPIGGAFDYEAGVTYTPPRWTGRAGIEWFVRFIHDPIRLFGRYFVEPWALVPWAVRDILRCHRLATPSGRSRLIMHKGDAPLNGARALDVTPANANSQPQDAA
jgi:N-acetylglucosaminyldiphosphoundecaprenol N-acetyl-beta-D-mannosaminyltransferase